MEKELEPDNQRDAVTPNWIPPITWSQALRSSEQLRKNLGWGLQRTGRPANSTSLLDEIVLDSTALARLIQSRQGSKQSGTDLAGWKSRVESDRLAIEDGRPVPISLVDIVGQTGLAAPTAEATLEHLSFLSRIDLLGFLAEADRDRAWFGNLRLCDLGTLIDLNLLAAALGAERLSSSLRILEVGGGYGRLAEGACAVFGRTIAEYVLVDAVPSSLLAAKEFLSRTDIGAGEIPIVYDGPVPREGVTILPDWNEEGVSSLGKFDVFINVESFQEMSTTSVSEYLAIADRHLALGGIALLSNSRVYVNRDAWPWPPSWRLAFSSETPRSWTSQHPLQVWVKEQGHRTDLDEVWAQSQNPWRHTKVSNQIGDAS